MLISKPVRFQIKREKAIKRKEALEEAKRQEEEARLAEVEGLVDLLQREPGPFRYPRGQIYFCTPIFFFFGPPQALRT
jgi:hypothetical protein